MSDEQFKKRREELGASVMDVAQAADLHPQTVYKIENGGSANRNSVNRVRKALSHLQERQGAQTKSAG